MVLPGTSRRQWHLPRWRGPVSLGVVTFIVAGPLRTCHVWSSGYSRTDESFTLDHMSEARE